MTIIVDAATGRRGLFNGQLHVADLDTALQLVSRRGGTIRLAAGDYWPSEDKGYFDVRLLSADPASRLVILGSSTGDLPSVAGPKLFDPDFGFL
jgi:hypothetical protein